MEVRRKYIVFGLIAVVALVAVSLLLVQQLAVTSADDATGQMSFNVTDPAGACDDPDKPTKCDLDPGSQFTLSVSVNSLPPGDAGYIGMQTLVYYGDLVYEPAAAAADEIVWPDSALPVRSIGTGSVAHGSASGIVPPFPESTHVGNIVEMPFTCSADPQAFKLALIPQSAANPDGAGFKLGDLSVVPAKTVGQQDVPGFGLIDVAATLDINCGQPPTATPPPLATPTPCPPEGCPTPTDTPVPPTATDTPEPTETPVFALGDVNCDGMVNSVDASLVLQLDARLISSLDCGENADVNEDGEINAIDALFILQHDAGLIDL